MSTPPDPGRPEDEPGYPDAPSPPESAQNSPVESPYAGGPTGSPSRDGRPDVPPPKEVVWATYAMYAAIAFSLISLAVRLIDSAGYKDAIRDANAGRPDVDVDTLYTAAVASAVVVTLVVSATYVFLAINLRKGINRARTTTWIVVVALSLLGLLMLRSKVPAIAHVFDVLVLLANAATLVLLAMRPSSQFFAAMKQPRHPQF
jgi:hypothetical protein